MAKRKRLSPLAGLGAPQDETMRHAVAPAGLIQAAVSSAAPPVARVAGDAAAQAALAEMAEEMQAARRGGRMVLDLPLAAIETGHLMRDRMGHDPEEMAALKASLAARGQQAPVEVVELGQGRYGLVSGARRLAALQALADETGEPRFQRIQALLRPFSDASDAYLAMVEENEIRADLSFYERGRLAAEAARMGIFPSPQAAVKHLFANTTPSRRSKILSFVAVHEALGAGFRFPAAIPERLGLALAQALAADRRFAARVKVALAQAKPETAAQERGVLERALKGNSETESAGTEPVSRSMAMQAPTGSSSASDEPASAVGGGVQLSGRPGRVVLSGPAVTEAFIADLRDWMAGRGYGP